MKIGTSFSIPVVSDVRELVPSSDPIVFVVGAFAHGKVRSRLNSQILHRTEAYYRIPRAVSILMTLVLIS